jgi:GNAT superfamily N-acetyltransferase
MHLRDATPADLDDICAMTLELAEYEHMADQAVFYRGEVAGHLFGAKAVAHVVIAEVDGGAAGMALWFPTFSTFLGRPGIWLEDLFVRPAFRSQGLGRALLSRLRSMTTGRVEWSVLDWNQPAIDFYAGLGADPVEGWTTYRLLPDRDEDPAPVEPHSDDC